MRFLVSAFFIATVCLQAQDAPPPGGQPKRGPQPPKNLKVLPADTDLRATMGAFRTALGQQCFFCHVQATPPDFASDENPKKETARLMITMVKEINAKFPDGKIHVTCYTCHRGKTTPETTPAAAPAQ